MTATDLAVLGIVALAIGCIAAVVRAAVLDLRSERTEVPRPLTARRLADLTVIEPDDSTIIRIYRPDRPNFTPATTTERIEP